MIPQNDILGLQRDLHANNFDICENTPLTLERFYLPFSA